MASIGQVIFWGMIILIFVFAGLIILFLSIAFSRSQTLVVESRDVYPVGNIGEDVLLDCSFVTPTAGTRPTGSVSVTWRKKGLSGVVFSYQNQAAHLQDQNLQFKDRTQIFPAVLAAGNASLLLFNVGAQDAGAYSCSVSAPSGQGSTTVHLRVAAYSSPSFSMWVGKLTARAQRWYPKPNVTWTDHSGHALSASTFYFNNSGIFTVMSNLYHQLQNNETYTCLIRNNLVTSVSLATVTGNGVTARTRFIVNHAP